MSAALRALGHLLFAALSGAALAFCVSVSIGALGIVGQPFLGFAISEDAHVNAASLRVWGADQLGARRWDRIAAVDGAPVTSSHEVLERAFARPLGDVIVYELHAADGSARFLPIPTRTFTASDLIKSHASLAFLGLVFVVIAVLLYCLRPSTAEAWAFFGFFATVGVVMASVVDLTWLWRWPPIYTQLTSLLPLLGLVLVGVITRAYTWRGENDREGRWLRRVWWTVTVIALLVGLALNYGLFATKGDLARYLVVDQAMYGALALATVIGLSALVVAYRRGRSPHQRARLRQILWAWPVGAGIPTVNLFFGHVLELFGVSLLWNGFLLLVPLSTADAVVRHDLLRLTDTARRLVGGMTVAAVMGMALGFAMWAAVQFLRLTDVAGMVALAALLFAIAAPVTHRVQRYVDDLLRSSPYDAGRLLAEFTARASTAKHLSELTSLLEGVLARSVKPSAARLYRLDRSERRLLPVFGASSRLDVTEGATLLLENPAPVLFDDELRPPREFDGAALCLRLAVAGDPVGLLALFARDDERPYEGGDVAFVSSMAGPLAAALINTRAYESIEALNLELEARVETRTHELAQKNAELALLNQRKDELVATVSHDFRSPLAVIRQNVQTILRDLKKMDPDDLRFFLEGVLRQEDRLSSMCANLLDLARLKQREAPSADVDVAAVARAIVDGFSVRAEQAGVKLALVVEEGAPVWVRGENDRLGQALQNLVDNALKFTPRGGSVDVRLMGSRDDDGRLLLEVHDTGCGVPGDAVGRLFEPFFQVPRTSHTGQGSGLGLAIVKAVVEAHGGRIDVESQEGEGTTFRISLAGEVRARERAALDVA